MQKTQIKIRGKTVEVPFAMVANRTVIITGKWLKTASVHSEAWLESEAICDPAAFISELMQSPLRPDILTFAQQLPDVAPKWNYPMQQDNVAAIPLTTQAAWLEKLSQDTRRNIRLAAKRGIEVRSTSFGDELVEGIVKIYNETPIRQGRKFWHYGKKFDTVKVENGTFVDRSQWIGAYIGTELVGFLKYVQVGKIANIMQILALNSQQDKKPMNALVAKAVELACQSGLTHLIYRKYVYRRPDALTEFKRRNGFEAIFIPRYFVPLTGKGRLALKLHLNQGIKEILPVGVAEILLKIRNLASALAVRRHARS